MSKFEIFFKGLMEGFRSFQHTLTNIVNFILLLIVYIFGIGIVAVISKLFRKHYLGLIKEGDKSNWKENKLTKQPLEKYYRMF
jgi:uncharacterized protein YqhQ